MNCESMKDVGIWSPKLCAVSSLSLISGSGLPSPCRLVEQFLKLLPDEVERDRFVARKRTGGERRRGVEQRRERTPIVDAHVLVQTQTRRDPRRNAESLLAGKLYDDRGNRMGQAMPPKVGGVGATMSRGLCSKAASQTPDRSRASRQRKSRNRF
jgi:hypothetical protein